MKEPIAIIGIGCRFPGGVNTPASFWEMLVSGRESITEVPASRFDLDLYYDPAPATPGKVMSRWGGYLDQIDQFDARFFGISPREAARLDPQQRLLLEVAWEAIQDAGQLPETPAARQTGVFVGMWLSDFEARLFNDPTQADFYMTTGSGRYSASGRLSYTFGFQGPSITVDTACSSSLVAVHLAVQSLRNGESNLALAGGANVILQPHITIAYSQSKMMAPDGHCKFGDAAADGYVRSEGAGMVVLKRLSDALADGDPIYAVIRGSAVNNDGRTSGYLATPGSAGQEEMLQKAYADAAVSPGDIQYVEAHGTGTNAGDPVEIGALGAVLATNRATGNLCRLGSVKTNFGHTEGAAGIAGLIKVALSLKNRLLPASLHFQQPSPKIPWDTLPVRIQSELTPWPEHDGPALAGVSAFGIAGTNAHVVLEETPTETWHEDIAAEQDGHIPDQSPVLLPVSAHTPEAVRSLATAYQEYLTRDAVSALYDIAYTASLRRTHHEYRLSFAGRTHAELAQRLAAYLSETATSGAAAKSANPDEPLRVVFVFPGQGGQWVGMARCLLEAEPVFREAIAACEAAFQPLVDWSLYDLLMADDMAALFEEIDVIQPALFAIQVALAALWRSRGVEPDAILGHSLGEVAGAYVASVLTLQEAAQVICHRSRLMKQTSGQGAMAVVGLSLEQTAAALAGYESRLSIAVSNSPRSTVISGEPEALEQVLATLESQNIFCRKVKVNVASHSPQMEPLRPELVKALSGLKPQAGHMPIYSTVDGEVSDGSTFTADYWGRNLRQPVLFSRMVEQLVTNEHTVFIELSPHPILLSPVEDTLHHLGKQGVTIPSMIREKDDQIAMLDAFGSLYAAGYPLDWTRLYPQAGQVVTLPPYPWHRDHYWHETQDRSGWSARGGHPLIGQRLPALAHLPGSHFWENRLDARFHRYLRDQPDAAEPETVYAAMALAAASDAYGEGGYTVADLQVHTPLIASESGEQSVQIILTGGDSITFQIFSRETDSSGWTSCADGHIRISELKADWLYNHVWQPQPRQFAEMSNDPGHWLIFSGEHGPGSQLAQLIIKRGGAATFVIPGDHYARLAKDRYSVNPTQATDFKRLLAEVGHDARAAVYLWALDAVPALPEDANGLAALQSFYGETTLYLTQALAERGENAPRLWCVTRGAQLVIQDDGEYVNAAQTPLWGFGRVVSVELPDLWGGLIDLPEHEMQAADASMLFTEIAQAEAEDQIAFRDGQRYVLRLVADEAVTNPTAPLPIHPHGTYLITGGRGRLGLVFARWLVENGARHLVLVGRSAPNELALSVMADLEAAGAQVLSAQTDITDFEDTKRLLDAISRDMPPLRGIIHTAVVFDPGMIVQQSAARYMAVFAPKIAGTWNLHRLTQNLSLDFFAMFSSVASAIGLAAENSYAVGNAFLEGLTHYRRMQGLPALTISWGTWGEAGLAGDVERFVSSLGLELMPVNQALTAFDYVLRAGAAHKIVAAIEWDTFRKMHETRRGRPFFDHIGTGNSANAETGAVETANLTRQLQTASPDQRHILLINHVRDEVARIMGFNPAMVDLKRGFFKMGMDSLMSIQLRNRLEISLNCSLPPTVALEYPSVEALVDYIEEAVFNWDGTEAEPAEAPFISEEAAPSQFETISDDDLLALLDDELARIDDLTEDK